MQAHIDTFDILVLAAYLVAVLVVGLWVSRGRRDLVGYVLAGRDLPWWALLLSIVATETSSATFLSVPGISYEAGGDLQFLQLACGLIVGRCAVVALLLPGYFRGEILSAYEVLERRFGLGAKRTASLIFLVARNLGDGLRLFLAAIALERAFGLSLPVSVTLFSVVTVVYTLFGGMRSVVWNDCVQFAVYIVGGIAALVVIAELLPGGWTELATFATDHGKLRTFDLRWDVTDPYTLWSGILGGAFLSLATHGTDQLMVQRYLSARTQREAARAVILSGIVVLLQFMLFLALGVGLACFFAEVPPPVPIGRGDEAFAMFIVHHMPRGLVGLTLAAVFAAVMSTLASSLNSSATVAVNDFVSARQTDAAGQTRRLLWCQVATVAFGVVQAAIALAARYYSDSVVNDALAIASFTGGILLGVFFLGLLSSRAGQPAAITGMVGGAVAVLTAKLATDIAWPWFTVIGTAATLGCGWLASCCWPEDSGNGPDGRDGEKEPREDVTT